MYVYLELFMYVYINIHLCTHRYTSYYIDRYVLQLARHQITGYLWAAVNDGEDLELLQKKLQDLPEKFI